MIEGKQIGGVEVGDILRPRLTVEGLRNLLLDRRTAKLELPVALLVSEYDRRDLNQDLLGESVDEVAKEDQRPEHDGAAIAIIEGIPVRSHPDVGRGQLRMLFADPRMRPAAQPHAPSKIISLSAKAAPAPKQILVVGG